MLKKIRLTDFKSFVDEEVELAPLTLLVGANASGKSNFLDAIRFLQGLSSELTIAEVLDGEESSRSDAWTGLRGRAIEAPRVGTSQFQIESAWTYPYAIPGQTVHHQISCLMSPRPRIERERLKGEVGEALLETKAVDEDEVDLSVHDEQISLSSHKSLVSGVLGMRLLQLDTPRYQILGLLKDALQDIRFMDIQPSKMRDYGRRHAPLGNEGTNFSGVLAELCDDPETRKGLVDWLREISAPEVEDIELVEVKEFGDVMASFVESGGRRISARSISDGTLKFLGTLLALQTAVSGEVILIEEIDSGLHPTRIRILVELLENVVRENDIQVIATTHSPVVLQWLSDEALRNVIVFGRVPDHEGTIMRRLGDLPHFDEVVQRKGIEELFTTGWLEMAL